MISSSVQLDEHQVSCGMAQAYSVARWSPDNSTQNGAVIVEPITGRLIGAGCNRPPDGVRPRPNRPEKYLFTEHAERMAIYNALCENRNDLEGAIMICPWAACADCARAIVMSGIKVLIRHADHPGTVNSAHWTDSVSTGGIILHEGGVQALNWRGPLVGLVEQNLELLSNGKPFQPDKLWSPK